MLSKKEIYKLACKELEQRRITRQMLRSSNLKTASNKCPEIGILSAELNKTIIKISKSILSKNSNQAEVINRIRRENMHAQSQLKQLLLANGFPADFLSPKPVCEKCEDYGFVKNEKCSCLIQLIKAIMTKDLQKNAQFNLSYFQDFNLGYYSTQTEDADKPSPHEQMSVVYKVCKQFAAGFPNYSNGLLMWGMTGLGKTHLSLSIAAHVISRGFIVVYTTASELIRKMSDRYFGREDGDNGMDILSLVSDADLFILDDLGSEFKSAFSKSTIFDIINNRIPLNKPMIISTNLFPQELESTYGSRMISRVFSSLTILQFIGTDNRGIDTPIKNF